MNRLKLMKIIGGAALIFSMLAFVLPLVKFDEISISMLDLLNMSADVTDLMEEFGASSELINGEMSSYFVFCIILFVLPVLECLLLFVIRGKNAFFAGLAGVLVNNVLFFIFFDKIHATISLINEAISFWGMDMGIRTMTGTIVLWVLGYVITACACIFGLLAGEPQTKRSGDFRSIRDILPEEIPAAAHGPRQDLLTPQNPQPQNPRPQSRAGTGSGIAPAPPSRKEFYGGLIGRSGIYKGKIRLLSGQEVLRIGTDEKTNDVLLNMVFDGITYCELFYDEQEKEYYLRPQRARGVFLQSGQPLGKDRLYCLPRGTVFTVRDKNNEFELA